MVSLILLGCILLLHTQYSFCQSDESFYISTVKRLWQGDRLILDEWHPTQFYSPILLPLYALFRLFVGSDAGVILFFRIATVLLSVSSSIFFYKEVKTEYSQFASFCVAAILMLFSRANIAGPSYYNLNLHFSIIAFIMWNRSNYSHKKIAIWQSVFSGFFLSLAVLCQPYSIFPATALLLILFLKRTTRRKSIGMIVTILTVSILYIAIFLTKASPDNYLTNIRYVLTDPQHQEGIKSTVIKCAKAHVSVLSSECTLLTILMSLWFIITRRQNKQLSQIQKLCQIILLGLSLIKPLLRISILPCYSFFASITVSALPSFIYHLRTKEIRFTRGLYVLGICLAVCWGVGSNTKLDTMLVGYAISGIGSLLLLAKILQEEKYTFSIMLHQLTRIGFICICCIMLSFSVCQRTLGFYRDASIFQLNTRIAQGPAKGLLTTAYSAEQYNTIYETISEANAKHPDATVFYMKKLPWAYLCCDWKCYGPTTWTTEISDPRLIEYYDLHNNFLPDYCFIFASNIGAFEGNFFNNHKTSTDPNQMILSGSVYSILTGGQYNIKDKQYMVIFSKNAK